MKKAPGLFIRKQVKSAISISVSVCFGPGFRMYVCVRASVCVAMNIAANIADIVYVH